MKFTVVSGREATPAEIASAIKLRQVQEAQLPAVRAMAENWRNGVGLVTTAMGAVTFLAGPDVLKESSEVNKVNGGWLLGLALVLLTVSVGCALRASSGWPRWLKIDSVQSLERWESGELRRTVTLVHVSMVLAVVALLVLGVAGAVLLFQVPLPFELHSWY